MAFQIFSRQAGGGRCSPAPPGAWLAKREGRHLPREGGHHAACQHGGVTRDGAPHHDGLEIFEPQCVQKRAARRARSSAAEADMDEFRAGIHNDRGFGNDFRNAQM